MFKPLLSSVGSPFIGKRPFEIKENHTGLGLNASQKGRGLTYLVFIPVERGMSTCAHGWDYYVELLFLSIMYCRYITVYIPVYVYIYIQHMYILYRILVS